MRAMLHFVRDSLGALEAAQAQYGNMVSYPWPINTVIAYEPAAIAHVLADPRRIYVKGAQTDEMKVVMGEGLVTNNDRASWARRRALVTQVMSASAVRGFAPTFASLTEAMLERWQGQAQVDASLELRRLTFAIAGRTLLGADLTDDEGATVDEAVRFTSRVVHEHMFRLVPLPYWVPTASHRAFHQHCRGLDAVVARLIAGASSTSAAAKHDSVLERLVHARDDHGAPLDPRALRDEILTLLIAGYETTANTLSWVLGLIAAHPDVQARLHAELDASGADITSVDYRKTHPWLSLTMLETIRLYTAIPMASRRATHDDELAGYHIPANTSVVLPVWVLHRDARFWKDALTFSPQRFQGCPTHKLDHYLPFSKGERGCVGQTFALVEVAVIVARVLSRFSISLVEPSLPRAVSHVSLKPEGGLELRVRPRAPAAA